MKGIDLRILLGIVTIAISFIIYPIVLEGTDAILANANISTYTGLQAIVKISPMIVLVAMLFGGGLLAFKGYKETRARRAKKSNGRYK